jgi:hypothetical protein
MEYSKVSYSPIHLTLKSPETELIQSEYSPEPITYLEWCEKEAARMTKAGASVVVWRSGFGFCAVAYKR